MVAYLHFVSIILVSTFLLIEYLICTPDLQPPQVRILGRIDMCYVLAAIAALATGLARVFLVGKGSAFYLHNPMLYIKLALFIAVAMVSIPPTLQFMRWNRALKSGAARVLSGAEIASARRYLLIELVFLACIPLAGVLLARGIGMSA